MPKVYLTDSQRKAAAVDRQKLRTERIINAALSARGWDRQMLSKESGVDYQSLCRVLRGAGPWRAPDLIAVADALSLDPKTRAALCGAKEACRYEVGFKE